MVVGTGCGRHNRCGPDRVNAKLRLWDTSECLRQEVGDSGILRSPGSQPLPKVFARVLRSNPETGRSVSRYSAVGFHLKPTPIGTLRARVLRVLCLLFSLALPRARPQRLAPRQLLQKPSGSAKQGNAC